MEGRVHSIESFGTVDGPGIRLVVFLQGCPMRCKYCHNPDTWDPNGGTLMPPARIMEQYRKNKSFYKKGGITVTGGEPLLQMDFVLELFRLAKAEGVHTCIDTSGIIFRPGDKKMDELMELTDLVMLDIKHIAPDAHRELTGQPNEGILAFAHYLDDKNIPLWIRHVLVPGITDRREDLFALGRFIGTLSNVKAVDVLPYHTMGVAKYQELGIPYPLSDLAPADKEAAVQARSTILEGIHQVRSLRSENRH